MARLLLVLGLCGVTALVIFVVVPLLESRRDSDLVGIDPDMVGIDPSAPILVGAGDIAACDEGAESTARLLDQIDGTVITLGDNAYPDGSMAQFERCYEPTWGRHAERTRPAAGNHDYKTADAADYFEYFGPSAGDPSRGYYTYEVSTWQIFVLNSACEQLEGGCGEDSPQLQWLRSELENTSSDCVLAYWHIPRFSSGRHGGANRVEAMFSTLYDAGADVALVAHDHHYERFAPQNAEGELDEAGGVRQFVVGTGGGSLYEINTPQANSEFRYNEGWGVLKVSLEPDAYAWEFIGVDDPDEPIDSGRSACNSR